MEAVTAPEKESLMTAVPTAFYIVVPLVALVGMFGWLGLIFWASARPRWKSQRTAVRPLDTSPRLPAVERPRHAA
jgi:hypothetical protein